MGLSLERSFVESIFLVALAALTAALHYTRDFSSAYASFSSPAAAAAAASSNCPLYNYSCLLTAAAAAYAAARAAAACVAGAAGAASPAYLRVGARRVAIALFLPAAALVCYVGAGYPRLAASVVTKWAAGNWERYGEKDLAWCGRLFVLLLVWQGVLSLVVCGGRAVAGATWRQVPHSVRAFCGRCRPSSGAAGGSGDGGKNLELQEPEQAGGRGGGGPESGSIGDGVVSPAAGGREGNERTGSGGEVDAPGWGTEKVLGTVEDAPLEMGAPSNSACTNMREG